MAQVIVSVAVSEDDAYEAADESVFSSTATNIIAGDSGSGNVHCGMRFVVTGPASGDTIDGAVIDAYVQLSSHNDAELHIHLEDVDNAVDFATDAHVTSRVLSTANTAWFQSNVGSAGDPFTTPDFKSAVQEVVDRAGWASGNGMVVLFEGDDTTNDLYTASWDNTFYAAPQLTIDYTAAAGAVNRIHSDASFGRLDVGLPGVVAY